MTLDREALDLFARKGHEAGPDAPQVGLGNGDKVRRVMQLTADFARRPVAELRILDLGCGEGVYAIEAALRGAKVLALDARTERMRDGMAIAARHGLDTLEFRQEDVRAVRRSTHGGFDVVWLLGLLYHLDAPDVFTVLANLRGVCDGLLVVDTLIAPRAEETVEHEGRRYDGRRVREHDDADPPEVRRARVLRSIDNELAFQLTRESLSRALDAVGFSSVVEAHVPLEPEKAADRVTFAAIPGERVTVATYPSVNSR